MLRVAIIKKTKDGFEEVVPGYNDENFLARLKAKFNERFLLKETVIKRRFTRQESLEMLGKAFNNCIDELKEETVKLT